MTYTAQQLDGFIDLLVEAVLRKMDAESRIENADESGQEQRRRKVQADGRLPRPDSRASNIAS